MLIGGRAPVVAVALWVLPDLLVAYHIFAPRAQGIVRMHRRFATSGREVWLTIDDGPDPEDTPRLLALLQAHGARATFFVIGELARLGTRNSFGPSPSPAMRWRTTPTRIRSRTSGVLRPPGCGANSTTVSPRWPSPV